MCVCIHLSIDTERRAGIGVVLRTVLGEDGLQTGLLVRSKAVNEERSIVGD